MRDARGVEPEIHPGHIAAAEETVGGQRMSFDGDEGSRIEAWRSVIADALLPIAFYFERISPVRLRLDGCDFHQAEDASRRAIAGDATQNGFTITKITIAIIRIVGTSLIIL